MRTRRPRSLPLPACWMSAFAATMLAAASAARANGAFPDEFSLYFPANAPHRILIGANFGLLVSEDDGATWRYSCEPWVTVGSSDPLSPALVSFYQVTTEGAVLAVSGPITRSTDDACTWPTSAGSVANQSVQDIFPDPSNGNFVLATIATSTGSYVVGSHDGGATFDSPPVLDASPDLLTGIEIARSTPGVYYATSVSTTSGGLAKFYATTDSGAHWATTILPNTSAAQPRILAVDPTNSKVAYLRLPAGISDSIMMTVDGGQTFQTVLPPINGLFSSFLRTADGTLYAGTNDGRLYVRPAGSTTFNSTPRGAPHLRCLGQRPGTTRIYACADMIMDGFSLGYSDDNGVTFQPVMSFTQLLGPLTCSPVATHCGPHWERIQSVLGIGAADAGQPDAGSGGSGSPGGSHCGSAGADAWNLWFLLAFSAKRSGRSQSA